MPRDVTPDTKKSIPAASQELRVRAADHVFATLARAILSGQLKSGTVLPSQRELAEQFDVSTLVVREAIHHLEELELLHARQGSTTVVLDVRRAADIRLLQLQLELAQPGDRFTLAAVEQRALSPIALLALAERRITAEEVDELELWLNALPDNATAEDTVTFRLKFWEAVARATRNPVVLRQIRWWQGLVRSMERFPATEEAAPSWMDESPLQRDSYRGLLVALRKRRGAASLWLKTITPLLERSEQQANHPLHDAAAANSDDAQPETA